MPLLGLETGGFCIEDDLAQSDTRMLDPTRSLPHASRGA
jgi:hypothetical protein